MIKTHKLKRIVSIIKNVIIRKNLDYSYAIGLSSMITNTNIHIPMLDYDKIGELELAKDILKLTQKFKLKEAHIYKTTKGYHVIFPYDLLDYSIVKKIIVESKSDWRYKMFAERYGKVFLRVAGKYKDQDIKFYGTTNSIYLPETEEKEIGDSILKMHETLLGVHEKLEGEQLVKQ